MALSESVTRPLGRLGHIGAEGRRLARAARRLLLRPQTIRIEGVTVPLRPRDWAPRIVSQLYREVYELPERRAVARIVRPGDRVLEVGTAIGLVAMAILVRNPAATRHYEANPDLAEAARATFSANGVAPDLRAAALVPDDHAGDSVVLHLGAEFWSGSLLDRAETDRGVAVPAARIGTVLAEFRPSVIVMDVEGAECALLAGDLAGVRLIAVELHRRITGAAAQSRLVRHLIDQGFHVDFDLSARENVVFFREIDAAAPPPAPGA